ncbi:MAG: hypothetical protein WDW36_010246 [Sanguina aurantia]
MAYVSDLWHPKSSHWTIGLGSSLASGHGIGLAASLWAAPSRLWSALPGLTGLPRRWATRQLLAGARGPGSGTTLLWWLASAYCFIRESGVFAAGAFAMLCLLRSCLHSVGSSDSSSSMHTNWMLDVPLGLAICGGCAGWVLAGALGASQVAWLVLWELWCVTVCHTYARELPEKWVPLRIWVVGFALPVAVGALPFLGGELASVFVTMVA